MARALSIVGAPEPDRQRDAAMQRVRVGITGLAVVFLLTLLAASLFTLLGQDTHAPSGNAAMNILAQDSPKEPLAELGVAPGNAPKTPVDQPVRPSPPHAAPGHL